MLNKIWVCIEFKGHYPVGTSAMVRARTSEKATKLLEQELSKLSLTQEIKPTMMRLLEKDVLILDDDPNSTGNSQN